VAAQAGGARWRSKALPFSQAQALASPRLGPSAVASAVKTGLPLARASGCGSCGSAGAALRPLRRRRADPGSRGASSRRHGSSCVPGLGLGLVLGAGGVGHWGLCCVLRSGRCSWSRRGFLLSAGQGGSRSWLRTGKGCSLVCTGAWSRPRSLWDEPGACRTLFPLAVWPVSLHHVSALAPVRSILNYLGRERGDKCLWLCLLPGALWVRTTHSPTVLYPLCPVETPAPSFVPQ